jgi:hypothetical protein
MTSYEALPEYERQIWQGTYGSSAPFVWAQQAGLAEPAGSAFGALDPQTQSLFYGTYGQQAPTIWSQQAAQNAQQAMAAAPAYQGPNWGTPWFQPGGVATGMWADRAGTTGTPYGTGVINQGRGTIQVDPSYLPFLQGEAPSGRYIPGSGSYLGWQLDKPGLLATIGGSPNMLTTWGSGAVGDPSGTGPRTPEQWVQSPRLFSWEGMMSGAQGPIASLFGRSDTPSGISTDALNAPEPYWRELYTQIANGRVQPSAAGWQFLQSVKGVSPQQIGGAAPQQAATVGAGTAGTAGAGGPGAGAQAQGSVQDLYASMQASAAAEQAARQAYNAWLMRTGDEKLAFDKAQQEWANTFQREQFAYSKAVGEAGLTGQYQGQQTLAAQQQAFAQDLANRQFGLSQQAQQAQTGLGLLGLQAGLQGPRDWLRYQQLNAATPQGMRDLLGAFAGQYRLGAGPQGTPGPATLESRVGDLLAPQGTAGTTATTGGAAPSGQPGTSGLPNPWQLNQQAWQQATPAQQQMALGAYEGAGYYGPDVEQLIRRSGARYTFGGA